MVPDPIGPDDRYRPCGADLQAVRLAPLNLGTGESEFLQPPLEEVPRLDPGFARTAGLLLGYRAQKNMPLDALAANFGKRGLSLHNLQRADHFRYRASQLNTVLCH